MNTKGWLFLSLLVFSFFSLQCCQDRLFDNPFDPQAGKILLEVVNTIFTAALVPQGLCWDGSTLWNVDYYTNTLYSLNRLNGNQVRALSSRSSERSCR